MAPQQRPVDWQQQFNRINEDIQHLRNEADIERRDNETNIKGLQASLNSALGDIELLKKDLLTLKEDYLELQGNHNILRNEHDLLINRVDYQEDSSRRLNLRFSGIVDHKRHENWENSEALVLNVIKSKLGIKKDIEVERAHRTGKYVDRRYL